LQKRREKGITEVLGELNMKLLLYSGVTSLIIGIYEIM